MQSLNGEMTQNEYDVIRNKITALQMLEMIGENHKEEIEKLKKAIEYEDGD